MPYKPKYKALQRVDAVPEHPVWLKIPAVSTPLKFLGLGVY